MNTKDCPECHHLRESFWQLSAELDRSQDELKMTHKNAPEYTDRKTVVQRLQTLTGV